MDPALAEPVLEEGAWDLTPHQVIAVHAAILREALAEADEANRKLASLAASRFAVTGKPIRRVFLFELEAGVDFGFIREEFGAVEPFAGVVVPEAPAMRQGRKAPMRKKNRSKSEITKIALTLWATSERQEAMDEARSFHSKHNDITSDDSEQAAYYVRDRLMETCDDLLTDADRDALEDELYSMALAALT